MNHRWLALFVIAFITASILILFWFRLKPIEPYIPPEPDIIAGSKTNPVVTFVNPKIGSQNPKVTIVEYSDFECDACKLSYEAITTVLKTETDVQYVWKNMPNESIHENSTTSALAAHCAGNQQKFWEFHDRLFEQQVFLSEQLYYSIAEEIGLDTDAFDRCYSSRETLPIVKQDYEEGLALGITASPTVFINNERYVGALTSQELLSKISQIKAK